MAAGRPYKDVFSKKQILAELRKCSGTQFAPDLAEAFTCALESDTVFQNRIARVYGRQTGPD